MDPTLDGELAPIQHHRTFGFARATTTPLRFVSSSMTRANNPRDDGDDDTAAFLHPSTAPRFMVPPLSSPSTASWIISSNRSTNSGSVPPKYRDPSTDAILRHSASPMAASLQAEMRGAAEEASSLVQGGRNVPAAEEIDIGTERTTSSEDRTASKHPSPSDNCSPLPCPGFLADEGVSSASGGRYRSTDPPGTEPAFSPRHGRRGPSSEAPLRNSTPSRVAAHEPLGGSSFLEADDMAFARGDDSTTFIANASTLPYVPASIFPSTMTPQRATSTSTVRTPAASCFASPQPSGGTSNVTPQRRTAVQAAGGFTTAAHVKDLAQKYFTILRQVQQEDSPVTANPSQSGAAAADSQQQQQHSHRHEQQQHPQHHLISRVFEVRSDAISGDPAAWQDKECYLHRASAASGASGVATKLKMEPCAADEVEGGSDSATAQAAPPSLVLTCVPEVSMLVNMGDVALCRLIDVRTRYTMEQEAYTQFLHATTATSLVLPTQMELTAPSKNALRRFLTLLHDRDATETAGTAGNGTAADGAAPVEVSSEAFSEVIRQLTAMLANAVPADGVAGPDPISVDGDSASVALLQQLLIDGQRMQAPPAVRTSLFKILSTLVEECALAPTANAAVSGCDAAEEAPSAFSMDSTMQEIAQQQQNEESYKQAGNLTHGAAARRELLQMMHAAVQHCLADISNSTGQGVPMVQKQRATDALLATESQRMRDAVERARQQEVARQEKLSALQAALAATTERRTAIVEAHHDFLASNEASVLATLRKIDELHGTLEQLIHLRSAKVKDFAKHIGSAALATCEAEEAYKQFAAASSSGVQPATAMSSTPPPLDVAELIAQKVPSVVSAVRAACTRRMASSQVASQSHVAKLEQNAMQLSSMLRHSVSQWVDVLLRNQQREAERMAVLQTQIKDAMSRYHQEDVDLFRSQYEESLTRRNKCAAEIESLEQMIKSDERSLAKFIPDFVVPTATAAGVTSRPGSSNGAYLFTSPGATPRPASGRLGHLPPFQSPSAVAHSSGHRSEQQFAHHGQTTPSTSLRTPLKQQRIPSPLHDFVQSPVPTPSSGLTARGGAPRATHMGMRSPPPQPPAMHHATCLVLVDADDDDRGASSTPPPASRRARAVSPPRDDVDDDEAGINTSRFTNRVVANCDSDDDDAAIALSGESDDGTFEHHRSVRRARGRHPDSDDGDVAVQHERSASNGAEVHSPLPHRPTAWHAGGTGSYNDGDGFKGHHNDDHHEEEPETELVDIDQLTVEEAVSLFRRSAAMTHKWILLLQDADVELMRDVRDMRLSASVWSGFLTHHPLLKSMLETLLDNPTHFITNAPQ